MDTGIASGETPSSPQEPSQAAIGRMCDALERSSFPADCVVLNGFSEAYFELDLMARRALERLGVRMVSGEDLLADETLVATGFVGSPDRLFALCRAGYAKVLTHALLAGGAVFPIVHTLAGQHGIILRDVMSDPGFGPYALRAARDAGFALFDGVDVQILRAGSDSPVPHGMVGEVVLREGRDPEADPVRTGVLSAMEQVPHRYRAPGLQGWMGFAQPAATVQDAKVHAADIAALINEHDDVLDARLMMHAKDDVPPVLQVETEAGDWIEAELLRRFEALTGLRPAVERIVPGQFGNTGRSFTPLVA